MDEQAGTTPGEAPEAPTPGPGGGCGEAPPGTDPRPNGRESPLERAKRQLEVDPARLAERLKTAREARGWNRLELATRADVAPSTVSNLERQQSASPDPVVALALALALGYESVAGLLGEGPAARGRAAREEPGPLTLEALVASLLRGVWAAQDARPGSTFVGTEAGLEAVRRAVAAPDAGAPEAAPGPAPAGLLGRVAGPGTTPVFVGAVFLVEPKTVG